MADGMMRGIGTLAMIALVVVILIVALVAYAWITISKYIHIGSVQTYKVLAANQTADLSQLMENMTGGFNTSQFEVSYSGNASVNLDSLQLQLPVSISVARYYNDSRAEIDVQDIPIVGNATVVQIKNGSAYYSCSSGINNSHKNYQCEAQPASNSIFTVFNTANLGAISQGKSTLVHYGVVNQSSHNGMPCTNMNGYFTYTNSTELNSLNVTSRIGQQQISSANITFLSCVSTQDKIPLTLYTYLTAKSGNTITVASLQLKETSFSKVSSSDITALPGPVVNSGIPNQLIAVVSNSGSTNFVGWSLSIYSDGSGSLAIKTGAHNYCKGCKAQTYPAGTIPTGNLSATLEQIGNVNGIPDHSCPKSVSFGTTTSLIYNNQVSGDISCINDADPVSYQNLWSQITAIENQLNLSS